MTHSRYLGSLFTGCRIHNAFKCLVRDKSGCLDISLHVVLHFVLIFYQDIVIEAGLVTQGSVDGVMSGKHYNRSILLHKTMYESLERMRVLCSLDESLESSFLCSLTNDQETHVLECIEKLRDKYQMITVDSLRGCLCNNRPMTRK